MKGNQIYIHGEKAYIVISQRPIYSFAPKLDEAPNMAYVQEYMKWLKADHVLQTQTHFMFCETIPDVDFENVE